MSKPLLPLKSQPTALCHYRWQLSELPTEFVVIWRGAGFEHGTAVLQSGALQLSHLALIHILYLPIHTTIVSIHIPVLLHCKLI
jgi:hypothetical protein